MKKNLVILILLLIFIVSFITLLLIFNYLDPYEDKIISLISIGIAFFFSMTTFLTLVLYFFKKIYFRGELFMNHVMISFRQGIMISILGLGVLVFVFIGAPVIISSLLLGVILLCLELFLKNLEI